MILLILLSNMVTLVSLLGQRFYILTRVGSCWVLLTFFFKKYFFMFYPPTFYFSEVELHFFFPEVIMLWFDLLITGIQNFFLVFFYLGLSQLHIHGCRVCDLTWFYCFFFFQLCPLILNCFIIQVNLNQVFFIFFDVIFFYYHWIW
jgi:hypothetical protein